MPGTIETDGRGAPTLKTGAHLPDPGTPLQGSVTGRAWRRLHSARPPRGLVVAATIGCWAAAAVTWTLLCLRIDRKDTTLSWDLMASFRAEVAFVHGSQPYSLAATHHRLFVYPPSALLLDRPLADLSIRQAEVFGLVATAVLMWLTVIVAAHVVGRRPFGLTAAVVVLALHWTPAMVDELKLANVSVLCAFVLAVFFLLALRDHWMAAGILIALTLSIKPLLLPVLLVFVLARKWRPLAVTIAIPAVLNAIGFAVVKDPGQVFSKLPSLLNRSGSGVYFNSAWVDVLRQDLGVSDVLTILVRLATVALTLAAVWWCWRRQTDDVLRLVITSSLLLIGTFLAWTLSESHFMLALVPLAMTVVVPGSPMRWPPAWIGTLLFIGLTPPASLLGLESDANFSLWRAFGMTLVLLTVLVAILVRPPRRRAAPLPGDAVALAAAPAP